MKSQVEFNAGLRRERSESSVSAVVDLDDSAAHIFEIGFDRTRQLLKAVPVHHAHGNRNLALSLTSLLLCRVVVTGEHFDTCASVDQDFQKRRNVVFFGG